MRKILLITLTFAIALLLSTGCGGGNGGETTGAMRSFGTMGGLVISIIDESPIPNATLEIWSVPIDSFPSADKAGGQIKLLAHTDSFGRFTASVPVGRIWIRADADKYKRSPPQYWALSPDSIGELNFVLYPGEGDFPFDPPEGFDVVDEGDGQEAFDPCYPGFDREGPHDDKKCGGDK